MSKDLPIKKVDALDKCKTQLVDELKDCRTVERRSSVVGVMTTFTLEDCGYLSLAEHIRWR